MFRKVMVAVDGSEFSERALAWAGLIARDASSTLHLVMVHEGRSLAEGGTIFVSEHVDAQQREAEMDYLDKLAERLRSETGRDVDTSLLTGVPANALSDSAARRNMDVLIMSTHGRGGVSRMWLGSVADRVVRRTRVPVMLVRPPDAGEPAAPPRIERVLAAVDGSAVSDTVLHEAAALCTITGAPCSIMRAVVPPSRVITSRIPDTAALVKKRTEEAAEEAEDYLRRIRTATHWQPTDTRTEVVIGHDAASAVLRTAETEDVDVIVIGTRGHGGATRWLLGSVADKVIRGARIPVLVCPARATD